MEPAPNRDTGERIRNAGNQARGCTNRGVGGAVVDAGTVATLLQLITGAFQWWC